MTLEVGAGDVVSFRTCGGGGFGVPAERHPALVLDDVRQGKVSVERACEIYCVVVDRATWTVDAASTARLRAVRDGTRSGDEGAS